MFLYWICFTQNGQAFHLSKNVLALLSRSVISCLNSLLNTFYVEDHLFWSDGGRDVIERCTLDGDERQVLVSDPNAFIVALVIDGDKLYYTAWNRRWGHVKQFKFVPLWCLMCIRCLLKRLCRLSPLFAPGPNVLSLHTLNRDSDSWGTQDHLQFACSLSHIHPEYCLDSSPL